LRHENEGGDGGRCGRTHRARGRGGDAGSAASGAAAFSLVPNAVAFIDRKHGILGTGWEGCASKYWHCRLQGTISVTSDGGKTWRVVRKTTRPVIAAAFFHDVYYVQLDDGQSYEGRDAYWRRVRGPLFKSSCPKGWQSGISADFLDRTYARPWSVCLGPPGAGNEAKAVYRGRHRVAFTPIAAHGAHGGISLYGYPSGIAGDIGGFGIIWESRGTLYVTHDGGHHWNALPKVARPEVDFGDWANADVYPSRTAFVLLSHGGGEQRRLIETTDTGRTWRVVHRWR
jgi:hypothetical protein